MIPRVERARDHTRRFHGLCLRTARRHGLRTLEGDALYDLAGMSFDADEEETAMEHVSDALAAYGPGHGRVYALAHDVAWFWMERSGRYEDAGEVLLSLVDHLWEPRSRLLLLSNLTRAAAGAGWLDTFERSWSAATCLIQQQSSDEGHAIALIHLAEAALLLGYRDRASAMATDALAIARQRREGQFIHQAETLVASIRSSPSPDHPRTFPQLELGEHAASVADALVGAMRARRDGAPVSPIHALCAGSGCG